MLVKTTTQLYLFSCYLLGNTRGEGNIPEHVLRDLARLLLPHILAMYETDEGKKELARWKAEQEQQDAAKKRAERRPLREENLSSEAAKKRGRLTPASAVFFAVEIWISEHNRKSERVANNDEVRIIPVWCG